MSARIKRKQPLVGSKRAAQPDMQLPGTAPDPAVKAEDGRGGEPRSQVPSPSTTTHVNSAIQEINSEAIATVVEARSVIMNHDYFNGINAALPLGMRAGGGNEGPTSHYRQAFDTNTV